MAESALRNLIPSARDRILSQQGQMPSAPMPQETFRGQAFNTMYDMFGGNSDDPARRAQATRRAEGLVGAGRFAADFTPVVGDALAIDEAVEAYRQGNMGQAAILGGLTMLGMVPVVGDAAAKAAKNVINTDYRGSHQPPTRDYGAPLNDLTMLIPEDVYSAAGPRLYGVGNPEVDREAFRSLRDARGKPEAEVTVYRAVPENVSSINEGDWVTTSKKYADMHGERTLGGNYKIIEQKAKAKDLFSEGYPYEFGYSPLDLSTEARMQRAEEQGFNVDMPMYQSKTEYDLAHEIAQRNAAVPVEQGGLGLATDNTAMDRAKAMGFDTPAYHGTNNDIAKFDTGRSGAKTGNPNALLGIFTTPNTQEASRYAEAWGREGGNVMPLVVRSGNTYQMPYQELDDLAMAPYRAMMADPNYNPDSVVEFGDMAGQKAAAERLRGYDQIGRDAVALHREKLLADGYDTAVVLKGKPMEEIITFDPANIRSRFAAFDPANRRSANILATAAGGTISLSALRQLMPQEEERPIQ